MARLNYGNNNAQVNATFAELKILERSGPHLVLEKACDMKSVPKNTNENITFQRALNGAVSTNTVTEGVTPASRALSYERVNVSLGEYVEIYEISSRQKELGQYDAVKDSTDVLRDLVLNTREAVSWNAFRAGTQVLYDTSGHSVRSAVDSPIALGRIQKAVRLLQAQKAWMFTNVDNGGMKEGTTPIEASYLAFGHTDLQPDWRNLPGFTPVAEYGSAKTFCQYEFGNVQNVRLATTAQLTSFAGAGAATSTMIATGGNTDVYPILIVGKHAWGCVGLRGAGKMSRGALSVDILDGPDKSDPGNQRAYIACRWYDAKLILNDNWCQRIEVGATDNP